MRTWARYFFIFSIAAVSWQQSWAASYAQSAVEADPAPLVINTGKGRIVYQIELAITPMQRTRGLMFRRTMARDHGMLFDFRNTMIARMWMKNTYLPLDMVFLKRDGTIAHIVTDTTPHSLEVISSRVPVRYVLELNAGEVARAAIKIGQKTLHPIFSAAGN